MTPHRNPAHRRLTRKQRRLEEDRQAAEWQRRALETATTEGTAALIAATAAEDAPEHAEPELLPLTAYRRGKGRHNADTGAVLVEYALILPLAVLLSVTGLFYGLAVLEEYQLTATVTEAVHLVEDDASDLIESAGGDLVCYWAGEGVGGCYDDGIGVARVQVVAEGKTWHPPLGAAVTVTAEAMRLITEGGPTP